MKKFFTIGILLAVVIAAGTIATVSAQTLTNNDMATWLPDSAETFRPFGHYTGFYSETDQNILATVKGDPGYGGVDFAYQHRVVDTSGMRKKMGKMYIGKYDFDADQMTEPVVEDIAKGTYYSFKFWAMAGQANDSVMKYIFDEVRGWDVNGDGKSPDIDGASYYPPTEWTQYSFDSIMWPDSAVNYQFRVRINYNEAKDAPVVGHYLQFDNWDLVAMAPPVGIREFNNFHFDIYPNPASGLVHVATELEGAKMLSVFNMVGKEVLRKPVFELQSVLDVSSLEQGIYMLRITDGVRERTRKLSIQ
ncbi:MAG: T9SS type A sorting domain-containing protein [Bacteroidales bacterium]|nr:T9SS type A sorting domain-containing protein [Bacteroidales bacterium]